MKSKEKQARITNSLKKNRGITLVALVVTIVVLIILSAISINLILNNDGIIARTEYAKMEQSKAEAREKIVLTLAGARIEKSVNADYNENTYLDEYIYKDLPAAFIEENTINLNGHVFELDRSVPQIGEYIGEEGNLPPRITSINVTEKTDTTASIEVQAVRAEGATYRYSYKLETDTEYTQVAENNSNTYKYENLDLTKNNILKVEIIKDGQSHSKTINIIKDLPPVAGTEVEKPSNWTSTQVTPIADGNGGTVPLPDGFYYIGGNYDEGLVISDKQGDTMTASGITSGNQFVWIPVSGEADLTRTEFSITTGQPTSRLETKYTEPYASGYPTEASEYNTMKEKVLQYGGFYIGRYEAGVNSTTLRTTGTTAQTVVSKKGVAPYNLVPWGTSMSDASEIEGRSGAVYLAKKFATQENYTSVTSTLCYGSQWDAMCRYIGDSQRKTPKKSAVELTGNVSTDVSKNIYDLAGNCCERTMEACNTGYNGYRVFRGSDYNDNSSVSHRSYNEPYYGNGSFRVTLYIK